MTSHAPVNISIDYLRITVERWDDAYIYAMDAHDRAVTVNYSSNHLSHLHNILRAGCQLNIILPAETADTSGFKPDANRLEPTVYTPELIVYEPDYLVDISAIAACFESYSRSPLTYLLHRLQPQQASSAIVLGNLASQFLDEELCLSKSENTYEQSIRQFFKENSKSLLSTELAKDFHTEARQQKINIRRAMRHTLPQLASTFQPHGTMVEPSFFSEMLGIQGRMDLLQLDMQVLIEQKSGKGGFPQPSPDTPSYQLKHYVQLLLYMLLIRRNYRMQYDSNGQRLQAFLLYSKYANGLLEVPYDKGLVSDAMQLRNGIVAIEYDFIHRALALLPTLTAEHLNTLRSHGRLWEQYQKPHIDALLSPIQAASPLERAYYLRMLAFVQAEHQLAKVGHLAAAGHASFADKWHCSLAEKVSLGNIYHQLQLVYPTPSTEGKVDRVVVQRHDDVECDVTNFRTGDIVILYAYADGTEPDARSTMVFRCTLADIGRRELTLYMRNTQVDARVLIQPEGTLWAIEHDFFESSFSSLYRGLHSFLSAPQQRRELLMLQRQPRYDESLSIRGDYGNMNELATRVRQARDFFLIVGPPGTGKTSFGLMTTLREELHDAGCSVLLMAYTNRAVDEICSKLVEAGIDFLRIGSALSCEDCYKPYLLSTVASGCPTLADLRRAVVSARVVIGTTTTLTAFGALFSLRSFTLAIIDEAGQILEPHIMGLLSATRPDGQPAIGRVVMIGDHKQLPAVVQQSRSQSAVNDTRLHDIGLCNCRCSLFERLLQRYQGNPHLAYLLTHQGRMHPSIAAFPSREFYGGRLEAVPLQHQLEEPEAQRVTFINVEPSCEELSSKVNTAEAAIVARLVADHYKQSPSTFDPLSTIGVIVPYRNQIAAVRTAIAATGIAVLEQITIDTVERFQGSQREHIIYSCTVSHPSQLAFLTESTIEEAGRRIDRKLNVAMTRARRSLTICGYAALLRTEPVYAKLIGYARYCDAADEPIVTQM